VPESAWLLMSFFISLLGMGWFALAIETHWQQVRVSGPLPSTTRRKLRALGTLALAMSFCASFFADHASMAPLVWIMGLAAAALVVAMTLAWRPRWLAILVAR